MMLYEQVEKREKEAGGGSCNRKVFVNFAGRWQHAKC